MIKEVSLWAAGIFNTQHIGIKDVTAHQPSAIIACNPELNVSFKQIHQPLGNILQT